MYSELHWIVLDFIRTFCLAVDHVSAPPPPPQQLPLPTQTHMIIGKKFSGNEVHAHNQPAASCEQVLT